MREEKTVKSEKQLKLEWKDVAAIIIAQFQVLIPFVLILLVVFTFVLVLLLRFWIRE